MTDDLGETIAKLYVIHGGVGKLPRSLEREIAELFRKHMTEAMAEAWMNGVLFSLTNSYVYQHDNPYRTDK